MLFADLQEAVSVTEHVVVLVMEWLLTPGLISLIFLDLLLLLSLVCLCQGGPCVTVVSNPDTYSLPVSYLGVIAADEPYLL